MFGEDWQIHERTILAFPGIKQTLGIHPVARLRKIPLTAAAMRPGLALGWWGGHQLYRDDGHVMYFFLFNRCTRVFGDEFIRTRSHKKIEEQKKGMQGPNSQPTAAEQQGCSVFLYTPILLSPS